MKRTNLVLLSTALLLSLVMFDFAPRVSSQSKEGSEGAQKVEQKTESRKKVTNKKPGAPDAAKENDPDRPFKMRGLINESEYLARRAGHVGLLRGLDGGELDLTARTKAIEDLSVREATVKEKGKKGLVSPYIANTSWTSIGPYPIPNGQTQDIENPVSGRTTAIAIHPTDPNTAYVGTAQGGVFRTKNAGQTWEPIFDNASSLAIGALALAPSDPTKLFVGTGEFTVGSFIGCSGFFGVGLYRVDDADTTATLVGPINPSISLPTSSGTFTFNIFNGNSISKILVSPTDANIVFVSTGPGVAGRADSCTLKTTTTPRGFSGMYRSTNALGAAASVTFTKMPVPSVPAGANVNLNNRSVSDMVFEPGNPNNLICNVEGAATTGGLPDGGFWRTTTALAATPAFTRQLSIAGNLRAEFAINKIGSTVTVIGITEEAITNPSCNPPVPPATTTQVQGVARKSVDGGVTWPNTQATATTSGVLFAAAGFCGGQCNYNMGVAIDPTDSNIIYIGGQARAGGTNTCPSALKRSTDGGLTFNYADVGLHADTHFIEVSPSNPNIVYTGDDGGVFRSYDKAVNWQAYNNTGFSATQFHSIALHATERNFILGGTQDNGTEFLKPDAPATKPINQWKQADFGDGGYALIDQSTTDTVNVTMYHTYFNQRLNFIGFARVTNTACANKGQWPFRGGFAFTPDTSPNCDSTGVQDMQNGIAVTDNVNFYAPMALGPSLVAGQPNVLYFGTDRLYRSVNRGDTMTLASQAPLNQTSAGPPAIGTPISTIGIKANDDNVRIVGLNNGRVYATTTGAPTLVDITSASFPINSTGSATSRFVGRAVVDPNNANVAYVGFSFYATTGAAGTLTNGVNIWKITNLQAATAAVTPAAPAWAAAGNGIPSVPVNALVIDPANSNVLYAGTDIGVYISTDGAANWTPFNTGMPRIAIFDLAIQNANRILRAGTHGRGIYEIGLAPAITISGTVRDGSNNPLAGVEVRLNDDAGTAITTGAAGTYNFTNLVVGGNYTVTATKANTVFAPPYHTFNDIPNSRTTADFVGTTAGAGSPPSTSQVLISEFRARGAGGADDEFIELFNTTASPITVSTSDGTSGWTVYALAAGGATTVKTALIPNGTVIPAKGHLLLTGPAYGLREHAFGDLNYAVGIPDDTGIALFRTTAVTPFNAADRLDAVGFTGFAPPNGDIYTEGTPLAPVGTTNGEYSFVRQIGPNGGEVDTNNNAVDFFFVSTTGGTFGGVASILGAPGPQNTINPVNRNNEFRPTLIEPNNSVGASPNRVTDGNDRGANKNFGTLTIRRRFTNNTGQTINRVRFRVVDITTIGRRGPADADIRLLDSSDMLVTTSLGTLTVKGTLIEQPPGPQSLGAGLNSVATFALPNPLANGQSTDVQFKLGIVAHGSFRFIINIEALP